MAQLKVLDSAMENSRVQLLRRMPLRWRAIIWRRWSVALRRRSICQLRWWAIAGLLGRVAAVLLASLILLTWKERHGYRSPSEVC